MLIKSILYFLFFIIGTSIFIIMGFTINELVCLYKAGIKGEIYSLLPTVGILLSAIIAALSLIINIENTNRKALEKENLNIKNSIRRLLIYLNDINESIKLIEESTSFINFNISALLLKDSRLQIENDKEILSLKKSNEIGKLLYSIRQLEAYSYIIDKFMEKNKASDEFLKDSNKDHQKNIMQIKSDILKNIEFLKKQI